MLRDRLREARKSAHKTQKEVASAIGVTESAYCGYETGKRQPDAIKISAIASYLGVSGDFLLETGIDEKNPATENGDGLGATRYGELSETNKAIVNSLIESLLAAQSDS